MCVIRHELSVKRHDFDVFYSRNFDMLNEIYLSSTNWLNFLSKIGKISYLSTFLKIYSASNDTDRASYNTI
jgi:hypothetical protein